MYSSRLPLAVFTVSVAIFIAAWANRPPAVLGGAAAATTAPRQRLAPTRLTLRGRPSARGAGEPRDTPVIWGDHAQHRVALTFDDGPHYLYTPKLLATLARHGAKATFFVNGYWLEPHQPKAEQAAAILARAHAQGHHIGNHTYHHRLLSRLTPEQQSFEILANERAIARVIGERPRLFRPPYGQMTDHSRALIARQGYTLDARWSATSHDEQKPAKTIAREVVSWLIHHEGGIVLLHDTQRESVEAVELILAKLARINRRRARDKRPQFQLVSLEYFLRSEEQRKPIDVDAFLSRASPLSKRSPVRYGGATPISRRRTRGAAKTGRIGTDGRTTRYARLAAKGFSAARGASELVPRHRSDRTRP
ncbi:MAG: polysaccharide deacetylase family protein [Myxococcales bacterium]|nr:polysaccharide deacetylase family protein [Myxococcales bacterium]